MTGNNPGILGSSARDAVPAFIRSEFNWQRMLNNRYGSIVWELMFLGADKLPYLVNGCLKQAHGAQLKFVLMDLADSQHDWQLSHGNLAFRMRPEKVPPLRFLPEAQSLQLPLVYNELLKPLCAEELFEL